MVPVGARTGDLGVAIAVLAPAGQGAVPAAAGLLFEVGKFVARMDVFHGVAMQLDDAESGRNVVRGQGLGDVRAMGVAIALERLHDVRRSPPIAHRRGRS